MFCSVCLSRYKLLGQSDSVEDIGTIQWHLVFSLAGAWFLVFCCLVKGVKSVGKVCTFMIYVPVIDKTRL